MIRLLQINVGGGRVAQSVALQTAAEQGVDLALISEFYKYGHARKNWHCDQPNRAAIVPVSNIHVDEIGGSHNDGFVWVSVGDVRLYSCYWSPNSTIPEYEDFLRRLEASTRRAPGHVIIAGDLNAKHTTWSSPRNDVRGEALADLVLTLDLIVCNTGSVPTREKDGIQSFIDVTLASSGLRTRVSDWSVLREESLSDHNCIAFTLGTALEAPQ